MPQQYNDLYNCSLLATPSMRGATPLDVAAASVMDNYELGLALQESNLQKVTLFMWFSFIQLVLVFSYIGLVHYYNVLSFYLMSRWFFIWQTVESRAVQCWLLKDTLTSHGILWRENVTWIFCVLLCFVMVAI